MSIKILLIEDNPDHAEITKKILEKTDNHFHMDSTGDWRQGLQKIFEQDYHVVLCDYRLPPFTALDILREMVKKGKDTPLVVVTASGNEKAAVELMKEGAYDYILKDLSYEETLPVVIRRTIERHNAKKEKEKLEEEIRKQEIFLERILNSLNSPFYVVNLDYTIALANDAAKSEGIAVGALCYECTHQQETPCANTNPCVLQEVLRTGKPVQFEHIQRLKNDSLRYFEVHGDPIFVEGGKITQVTEYLIDVTEQKKNREELENAYRQLKETQQQLMQSSKMAAMGQLAAGVSHELNQPLTGIKGFAQAALMDLKEGNPLRADLQRIVEQADRMDAIIRNMRLFARKSDFKMEELDINEPIKDSLALLQQQLKVHNIRTNSSLDTGLPKVIGDANQLQQAFLNLLTNARDAIDNLKHSGAGEITIKTYLSEDKEHVEIIFQDTGCGIPAEHFENIFNPFFTTKSHDGGMGLGLAIAYRIIEDHRGKIEFESALGKGTTFKVSLPVAQR